MKCILFSLATIFLVACGGNSGGGASGGATTNLDGYTTDNAGGGVTVAFKKDADGNFTERGYLSGGQKSGVWMTYHTGKDAGRVKSIASYTNGILNGPYYELNNRGQIESETNYKNNKYDGQVVTYKFGRALSVKNYKDNVLNGLSTDYYTDGVVQKEINFKNGKQHGSMKWYNEEGEMTMEYEYKNGEKVSGGIVKGG